MNNSDGSDNDCLISKARNNNKGQINLDLTNYSSNIPNISPQFDLKIFNEITIQNNYQYEDLKQLIINCSLGQTNLRFQLWRIFLGVFNKDDSYDEKLDKLINQRKNYKNLSNQYLQSENRKETKKSQKNQQFKNDSDSNVWNNFFDHKQLKAEIKKDVDRTHQDKQLFSSLKIKNLLTNILFIWSIKNPNISYRQGMNEIAAMIIQTYFTEAQGLLQERESDIKKQALPFYDLLYAEEDIFTIFELILNSHQNQFHHQQKNQGQINIQIRIQNFLEILLNKIDNELYHHIKQLDVEISVFLIRWIRCIFTREFHTEDSLKVWDAIFFDYYISTEKSSLYLIDCIALAMFLYVRNQILERNDQAFCLKRFLQYPPVENLSSLITAAFCIRQALLSSDPESTLQQDQFFLNFLGTQNKKDDNQQICNSNYIEQCDIQDQQENQTTQKHYTKQYIEIPIQLALKIINSYDEGIQQISTQIQNNNKIDEIVLQFKNNKHELEKIIDQNQ